MAQQKKKHDILFMPELRIIYPNQSSVLMCNVKKEAYHDYLGFRFCPSCGKTVLKLCRLKPKKEKKFVIDKRDIK
jgi:hypothetical protein